MALGTILVCLNEVDRVDALMSVAANLAAQHDAHVLGLFVVPAMQVYPEVGFHMTETMIEGRSKFYAERAETVKRLFEASMRAHGFIGEFRKTSSASPLVANSAIDHARQADLVIASQVNPDGTNGVEIDFAEQLVMRSGRPTLLVPFAGSFETVGQRVIVGWNATRESARAVFDAIPLLKKSSQVWLVWADPQHEMDLNQELPAADIATALARHQINATAESLPTDKLGAGEALLNRVADRGADLLVMGAYGHSRMREFVFGGATRSILQQMTVPVLLSH